MWIIRLTQKFLCYQKSSNELIEEKEIHDIVTINQGTYEEEIKNDLSDEGSSWFNSNTGCDGLLKGFNALLSLFGENKLQNYFSVAGKQYFFLMNQFENDFQYSDINKFILFIKKMNKDSMYHNIYYVVISMCEQFKSYLMNYIKSMKDRRLDSYRSLKRHQSSGVKSK